MQIFSPQLKEKVKKFNDKDDIFTQRHTNNTNIQYVT